MSFFGNSSALSLGSEDQIGNLIADNLGLTDQVFTATKELEALSNPKEYMKKYKEALEKVQKDVATKYKEIMDEFKNGQRPGGDLPMRTKQELAAKAAKTYAEEQMATLNAQFPAASKKVSKRVIFGGNA